MNPELRAVLTEALKAHQVYRCSRFDWDHGPVQWWQCHGCDFKSTMFPVKGTNRVMLGEEIAADHHADVIASLPGVAVIQLPEPTEAVTMQDCAGSGKPFKPGTLSRDGEVAKCPACGTNRYVRDDGSIEPHQVPVAAVLAEGEDNHA
ncbi:hypothetical protein SEA_CHILDISH_52 [Mycobacterium phage Childish]|uniref:Uncharacterized protein n=7 Tax=Bclasvirinae TaxID=1982876 RepID=A0A514TY14_9CAUD|nr:hypothetical protein KNU70_gp051 [Mycobacterium phage Obutu]ATN90632.1 hypothetical protein SEA_LONGACAUDA_53 [Mycobacterium phage Longacauda]AVD99895.1 hypothetical protein SEA_HIGHSTUMP_54 [Mycobacterium phage HighStump]AWY03766.1 hypothetical protein MORTCELLUS_50 [Mycobacterium phage Mortcellus]AXC35435.1 hypothetical protein SEA_KAHVE_52 [Mycobacterium phage Kahve]AXC35694.1 hypothetical protein SEA_CHILDISH_52 [Mycobacterium phage Childish]AXC37306.1 hypothetical protein SEA_CRAFF_55